MHASTTEVEFDAQTGAMRKGGIYDCYHLSSLGIYYVSISQRKSSRQKLK